MKYKSRILALLLAGLVAFSLSACQSGADSEGSVISTSSSADQDANGSEDTKSDSENKEDSGKTDDTTSEEEQKTESDSGSEDGGEENQTDAPDDTAAETTAPNGNTENTTPNGEQPAVATTTKTSAENSGGNKTTTTTKANTSANTTTKVTTTTAATTTETTVRTNDEGEIVEIKTIQLGSTIEVNGEGIAVRGSKVGITKGGVYKITGTLTDGTIEVNTTKKVVLLFAGASITNSAGAAVNVIDAKRVTIELEAGTVNTLTDGGVHEDCDGAFFSNDTIEICGTGTLNVNATYAHGIVSDDDIILTSGTVNVTSVKSGLFANDAVDINGGKLFCNAGTNGIKCKGNININGGNSTLIGGTKEEKGAIISLGVFTLTGGTLYAIGNTFTTPCDASTQNCLILDFSTSQAANTRTSITSNNQNILTMSSPRDHSMILYSAPGIVSGSSYSIYTNGSISGGTVLNSYATVGGAYSGGTKLGAYAASGRVSYFKIG